MKIQPNHLMLNNSKIIGYVKNTEKSMKRVNFDGENLHIFWTTWGTSMKFSGRKWLKWLSGRQIFGKTTGAGNSMATVKKFNQISSSIVQVLLQAQSYTKTKKFFKTIFLIGGGGGGGRRLLSELQYIKLTKNLSKSNWSKTHSS